VSGRQGVSTVATSEDDGAAGAVGAELAHPRRLHRAPRVVRVALFGYGHVGQAVAARATRARTRLDAAGIDLHLTGALVRNPSKPRPAPAIRLFTDGLELVSAGADVVIEVLGGLEPARELTARALGAGVAVVTANKTLVAECGQDLRELARRHDTAFGFDAAVLAGVPFLGSLARRPLASEVRRLEGVLNGTSNFVIDAMTGGISREAALAEAVRRGYAEPDSAADTSGRDAAEKLTILLHLAGCDGLRPSQIHRAPLDLVEPALVAGARRLAGCIKPVALAALDPAECGAWVGPSFVAGTHPFADLGGVANALRITDPTGQTVAFAGPGAGPDVTAATLIDDIVELVAGGIGIGPSPSNRSGISPDLLGGPAPGDWFLAVRARAGGERPTTIPPPVDVAVRRLERDGDWLFALTGSLAWPVIERSICILQSEGHQAVALPALATQD
jgi:homoserine dehydrogenase